ncbi:hypothetical protein BMW23_0300 [Bodo saltans virus]|uniref:Uncharacterized protein n=1 Tax=Bodo saltans virus TaxID=2024608 RepID=A0A2H4UTY8_9VIRU|nr:hypothetical protein QJ851_gp0295 [Bodo saltans virus]ATZ80358.1 hypothetical protein BMW23_0300 [Bodo saltans virus]
MKIKITEELNLLNMTKITTKRYISYSIMPIHYSQPGLVYCPPKQPINPFQSRPTQSNGGKI